MKSIAEVLYESIYGEVPREVKRMLRDDYIPGGKPVSMNDIINWRRIEGFGRCVASTSYDIQSGPIYCGRAAEYIGDVKDDPDSVICLCASHTPHKIRKQVEEKQ